MNMATRAARATIIFNQKRDEFNLVTRRLIQVPSQYTDHLRYDVRMRNGKAVQGSCPDYVNRLPVGGCKHMRAADKYYRRYRRHMIKF